MAEPKVAKGMGISSFSDDMRLRGLTPGSQTPEFRTVPAGARLGRILHVSLPNRCLRSSGSGSPTRADGGRARSTFRGASPGLTAHDLEEGSFYDLMVTRYGIEIVGGSTQTVEPTVTGEEESHILGVPIHSPALLFERVTRSVTGETVEFTSSIYRGDRYRLVSELGTGGQPTVPIGLAARALDSFA